MTLRSSFRDVCLTNSTIQVECDSRYRTPHEVDIRTTLHEHDIAETTTAAKVVQEEQACRQLFTIPASTSDHHFPRTANFCRRCQSWKPPRSHHCSMLGTCVLKMDHFCLWVVNSVGLLNYKFFLLFLVYTTLACMETLIVLLPVVVRGIAKRGDASSRCDSRALVYLHTERPHSSNKVHSRLSAVLLLCPGRSHKLSLPSPFHAALLSRFLHFWACTGTW